jgi:hypothetical protein
LWADIHGAKTLIMHAASIARVAQTSRTQAGAASRTTAKAGAAAGDRKNRPYRRQCRSLFWICLVSL